MSTITYRQHRLQAPQVAQPHHGFLVCNHNLGCLQANKRKQQPHANHRCHLDRVGHHGKDGRQQAHDSQHGNNDSCGEAACKGSMHRDAQPQHLAVDEKGIDAHAGGHAERKVGKDTAKNGCQGTGEGGCSNHMFHFKACGDRVSVLGVVAMVDRQAYACTSSAEDLWVDQQYVRHGQKCDDACLDLRANGGATLRDFEKPVNRRITWACGRTPPVSSQQLIRWLVRYELCTLPTQYALVETVCKTHLP